MTKAEANAKNAEAQEAKAAAEALAADAEVKETQAAKAKAAETSKSTGEEEISSLLDEITEEERAENERILAADDDILSEEELAKKKDLLAAQAKARKAPEKYEYKLPDGMTIDQELAGAIEPIFKEADISQETAQKIVDAYVKKVQSGIAEMNKAAQENFNRLVEEMKQDTIKSLGSDYKRKLAAAAKARDMIASKELVDILNVSGLANHKEVIGMFIKVGKMLSEDNLVEGKAKPHSEKSIIDVLYDADKK